MKNPYTILEIDRYATDEVVKKAFRRLALKYHPDKNENGKESFIAVKWAYEILGDSEKKRLYDKFGYIEGEKENDFNASLFNLNKEVNEINEDEGNVRVKNFKRALKEKIPQTACLICEGLGFQEKAEGFFITKDDCEVCGGTGYVNIVIKDNRNHYTYEKKDNHYTYEKKEKCGFWEGFFGYLQEYR